MPDRPPSRIVTFVAGAVIGLTVLALVFDRRREQTGELLVQADGNSVRVSIFKDGKPVVSSSPKRSFTLLPGSYEVVSEEPAGGKRSAPRQVTVPLRGRVVLSIKAEPPAPPTVEAKSR